MTEYMTENEYDEYLAMSIRFEDCLIACAQEINMLLWGRGLVGEFNGDIDIYDGDDYYLVQFETWGSCECETDSVQVPRQYIFDAGFREYHKKCVIQERKDKEERKRRQEEARKAKTYRIVTDDRAEYERLKAIYG